MARRYVRDSPGRFAAVPGIRVVERNEPVMSGGLNYSTGQSRKTETHKVEGSLHPGFKTSREANRHAEGIAGDILNQDDPGAQFRLKAFDGDKKRYDKLPDDASNSFARESTVRTTAGAVHTVPGQSPHPGYSVVGQRGSNEPSHMLAGPGVAERAKADALTQRARDKSNDADRIARSKAAEAEGARRAAARANKAKIDEYFSAHKTASAAASTEAQTKADKRRADKAERARKRRAAAKAAGN